MTTITTTALRGMKAWTFREDIHGILINTNVDYLVVCMGTVSYNSALWQHFIVSPLHFAIAAVKVHSTISPS